MVLGLTVGCTIIAIIVHADQRPHALLTGPDGAPSLLLVAFSLLTMSLQRNAHEQYPGKYAPQLQGNGRLRQPGLRLGSWVSGRG